MIKVAYLISKKIVRKIVIILEVVKENFSFILVNIVIYYLIKVRNEVAAHFLHFN